MKKLQQFCTATILTLALTFSAFAGEMSTPGITAPPPPQSSVTGEILTPGASVTGDILMPGVTSLDPVTETALSLLQSLLSLF